MVDGSKKLAREKLAVAASPLRSAIATSLVLRPATAAELAAELDVPVEKVRYHLNRMRSAGLVDLCGKRRNGRVTENVYAADPRSFLIEAADAADLPSSQVAYVNARALKLMFREATAAMRAGTFAQRPETATIRFPLPLDEQGWLQAVELHRDLVEKIFEARDSSLRRMEKSGEKPILASAFVLFFERVTGDPRG